MTLSPAGLRERPGPGPKLACRQTWAVVLVLPLLHQVALPLRLGFHTLPCGLRMVHDPQHNTWHTVRVAGCQGGFLWTKHTRGVTEGGVPGGLRVSQHHVPSLPCALL